MGTKIHRIVPSVSVPPPHMVEFMVMVNRPSSKELKGLDRAEKYELLKANSVKHKEEIMAWIKEQGLEAEVFKIQEPTVFNMLFITCTPKVAEFLKNADGVLSVGRNLELSVGLVAP